MKIGEIAGRAGVSVDTVRFYERVGVLAPPTTLAAPRASPSAGGSRPCSLASTPSWPSSPSCASGSSPRRPRARAASACSGSRRRLLRQRRDRVVERRARTHHRVRALGVGAVVATEVHGLALEGDELLDDRLLVGGQPLGD